MKYEFRVGDYVENKDGDVGYISEICHCLICENKGFYEPVIRCGDDNTDHISSSQAENPGAYFKRIGKYDFTKHEQPKEIEKLDKFNDQIYPVVLKINELVDTANAMRESAK